MSEKSDTEQSFDTKDLHMQFQALVTLKKLMYISTSLETAGSVNVQAE